MVIKLLYFFISGPFVKNTNSLTKNICNGKRNHKNESKANNSMVVQGVQGQTFMFQFALADRNMQVRFGLKVGWES